MSSATGRESSAHPRRIRPHFSTPEGKYRMVSEMQLEGWKPVPLHNSPCTRVSVITYVPNDGKREAKARGTETTGINLSVVGSPAKKPPPHITDDGQSIAVLVNAGDSLFLVDYRDPSPPPLEHAVFAEPPTAHDFDHMHPDPSSAVSAVGFHSGEVMVHDPLRMTFSFGANKGGKVDKTPCNRVLWVPGQANVFVSVHESGCMYFWDTARTEEVQPPAVGAVPAAEHYAPSAGKKKKGRSKPRDDDTTPSSSPAGDPGRPSKTDLATGFSVYRSKSPRSNPASRWAFCPGYGITDASFSRTGGHVAVASRDGRLRIVHMPTERLVVAFRSYYGSFLSVAWSPDGALVCAGGEDDFVTVWSVAGRGLIARCAGHRSYVSAVAFDGWKCAAGVYRFGSVGQDCRMAFWEVDMAELALELDGAGVRMRAHDDDERSDPLYPPTVGKRAVPTLSPLGIHHAHHDVATSLLFLQESVVTASPEGSVKVWARPGMTAAWGLIVAGESPEDDILGIHNDNNDDNDSNRELDDDHGSDGIDIGIASTPERRKYDGAGVVTPGRTPAQLREVMRAQRASFARDEGWSSSDEA